MNFVLSIALFCAAFGVVACQLSCYTCKHTKKISKGPETDNTYTKVKGASENEVCSKKKGDIKKNPPAKTTCPVAGAGEVARCKKSTKKYKGTVNNEEVEMETYERKCEVKSASDPIASENECEETSALAGAFDVLRTWVSNMPGLGSLAATEAEDCYCSEEGCNGVGHVAGHVALMAAAMAVVLSYLV